MKYFLMLSVTLFLSCNNQDKNFKSDFEKIKACNIELFKGIRIEARTKKNGEYRVPFFTKEISGELYMLPNYKYYGCVINDLTCLSRATEKKFNIIEFAKANNVENHKEALSFSGNYINNVISEYTKIGIREVLSDTKIGDCVIFYFDDKNYIAYVPDVDNIYNAFWKSEFTFKNKIEDNWYSNFIKNS